MTFFEILRLIRAALAIGAPPDIDDESVFREWVCAVLCFLADLAELTATDVDDQMAAKLHALVDNDQHWGLLYTILKAVAGYVRSEDQESLLAADDGVNALATDVAIDPLTIIAIINLIAELFSWWRKR